MTFFWSQTWQWKVSDGQQASTELLIYPLYLAKSHDDSSVRYSEQAILLDDSETRQTISKRKQTVPLVGIVLQYRGTPIIHIYPLHINILKNFTLLHSQIHFRENCMKYIARES